MGIGASRLSSMVSEQDDLPNFPGDDLSSEIFQSPSVQFFMLNKETLMSMVELPALEIPGDESSTGFQTAQSQVIPSVYRRFLDHRNGIIYATYYNLGSSYSKKPWW